MAEGDAKRWLKYGCFGCLGCLGLIVLVVGLTAGMAYFRAKSESAEEQVLSHPVPAAPAEPVQPRPPQSETLTIPLAHSRAEGTLILDFQDAEFRVAPAAAGDPFRVEATYDKKSYDLKESSETLADGKWTYRIEFRRTSHTFLGHVLQQFFSSIRPSVRVFIPPDARIALEASLERGGLEIELGGTHVTSAVLDVSMGGVEFKVSEPLEDPLERLTFHSQMGGGAFQMLGNASPRILEIDTQMGGADLDLRGAWRADAQITLRSKMGGASVTLPEGVRIEGVTGRNSAAQAGELKLPTLRFTTSTEMGEVEFK